MVTRSLLAVFLTMTALSPTFSQNSAERISLTAETFLLVGGELNASFDLMIGVRGQYALKAQRRHVPYISVGIARDLNTPISNITSVDIGLGSNWKIGNKFTLVGQLGLQYIDETHHIPLEINHRIWHNRWLAVLGMGGIQYALSRKNAITLHAKQSNLSATAVGIGLQHKF